MIKTIKQIADELGVSKQAVHQKRKSKELSIALQPFTSIVDGIVYISVDGENLIKSAFKKGEAKTEKQSFTESSDKVVDNKFTVNLALETLVKQLEEKDKQLAEKDKQIERLQGENETLISSLDKLAESVKGAQALHAGTMQKDFLVANINPTEETANIESEKKGFFKRMFRTI